MTPMRRIVGNLAWLALGATAGLIPGPAAAQNPPIRIGVPIAIQLQVGRDTIDSLQLAVDEINGKGHGREREAGAGRADAQALEGGGLRHCMQSTPAHSFALTC
jgi:hypothetical protein